MRILITNDDGINSPVLLPLAEFFSKYGEVTVCAPKVEQSGMSHAIDFFKDMEIKRVDIGGGFEAYSIESTPADCVRFAVLGLKKKFDLVVSGINKGYNLGRDIVYSGTAGAIFEAARLDMKGIALSTDTHGFERALNALPVLYSFFRERSLFEKSALYNVNIPTEGTHEIVFTHLGRIYYTDEFMLVGNDIFRQVGEPVKYETPDDGSDIDAILEGKISVTPLISDRTNISALSVLK